MMMRQAIDKKHPRYTLQFYKYGEPGKHDDLTPVIPLRLKPNFWDIMKIADTCKLGTFSDATITGRSPDRSKQFGRMTRHGGFGTPVMFEVIRICKEPPEMWEVIR